MCFSQEYHLYILIHRSICTLSTRFYTSGSASRLGSYLLSVISEFWDDVSPSMLYFDRSNGLIVNSQKEMRIMLLVRMQSRSDWSGSKLW